MGSIFKSLILITLLSSCQNWGNEQAVIKQDIPAKEKELKDAIDKNPDSLLLHEKLIQYYQDNGNFDKAITETNHLINKDSTNSKLWDNKAILLLQIDDTANAIKAYKKAIDIYPDPQYIMSLGWIYAQTKNINAISLADTLLANKNAHAQKQALLIKGLYYHSINQNQKAIALFDNCLALDYTFMFAYREKGITLYDMEKYDDAINVLNKAITLQNNFDEGYYWLGKCYEKLNQQDAAIESYKTAILYNTDYVEAKDALAKLGSK